MKLELNSRSLPLQLSIKLAGADGARLDHVHDLDAKLEAVARGEPRALEQLAQAAKVAMVSLSRDELVAVATARAEARKQEAAELIGKAAPFAGASLWGPSNVVIPATLARVTEKVYPEQWKALDGILPASDRHALSLDARQFQAVVREAQSQLVSLGLFLDLERYGSDQPNNRSHFVKGALADACSIVLRPFGATRTVAETDRTSLGHAIGQAIGARTRIVHILPEAGNALVTLRIGYLDKGGRRDTMVLPIEVPYPPTVTAGAVLDASMTAIAAFESLETLDGAITSLRQKLAAQRKDKPEPRVKEELEPRLLVSGRFA